MIPRYLTLSQIDNDRGFFSFELLSFDAGCVEEQTRSDVNGVVRLFVVEIYDSFDFRLNDELRTFVTRKMSRVHGAPRDVVSILVDNRVHFSVAH